MNEGMKEGMNEMHAETYLFKIKNHSDKPARITWISD